MSSTKPSQDRSDQLGNIIDKRSIVLFSLIFVLVVFAAANIALKQIAHQVRQDTLHSLNAVLDTTRQTISLWLDEQLEGTKRASLDKSIRETTQYILKNRDTQDLDALSHSMLDIFSRYGLYKRDGKKMSFFVLDKNGYTIVCSDKNQLGQRHIIAQKRPDLIQRAFAGASVFVPPLLTNHSNKDKSKENKPQQHAMMFYLAPVKDVKNRTIALVATAHDPYGHFSDINKLGRIGDSGETYFYDEQGRMLSESRFQKALVQQVLLGANQGNILHVSIRGAVENTKEPKVPSPTMPPSPMWRSATQKETSANIYGYRNYRGAMVMGSWTWLDEHGFGVASEIDLEEAMLSYEQTRSLVVMVLSLIALLAVIYILFVYYLGYKANLALRRVNDQLEKRVIERTQELDVARQAAEQAAKAKSIFLANMSHEIRTPLNAVLGYAQLMEKERVNSRTQADRLRAIKRAGQHLLGVINEILDISKIEAGAMSLVEEQFDLCQVVGDINDIFTERCQTKGLAWRLSSALPAEYWTSGDRQKLLQVLINLLGNAVKFTEAGEIGFAVEQKKSMIKFAIWDTGRGISKEDQARIFEPFHQSSTRSSEGTGLGLAISAKLIALMNGKIKLKSDLGHGTRINLSIPFPQTKQAQPGSAMQTKAVQGLPDGVHKYVMIVDDIEDNRRVLEQLLCSLGFGVATATDGTAALAALKIQPCDVVLTDIRMPEMDGIALHRAIRSTAELQYTPVIAVSASSLSKSRDFYIEEGFDDYIAKPFVFEEIYAVLEKHLHIAFVREESAEESTLSEDTDVKNSWIDVKLPRSSLISAIDHAQQGELSKINEFIEWLENESAERPEVQSLIDALLDHLSRYDMDAIADILTTLQTNAESE